MTRTFLLVTLTISVTCAGCGDDSMSDLDAGDGMDAGERTDGGDTDAGGDAGDTDAGDTDAGETTCESDSDCDDGNVCNGAETCGDDGCGAGTPASDGDPCDADGEPSTRDFCVGGLCSPTRCGDGILDTAAGELCDDGNVVEGDGCDNDCTPSCEADSDCDDGLECNGAETCVTATDSCAAGTPLGDGTACNLGAGTCMGGTCVPNMCSSDADCSDGDPCTGTETCSAGACAMGTPLDCDDMSPCTADACAAGIGCSNTLIDGDGDGHASDTLGTCGDDCDDTDGTVYPGAADPCDGIDNDCDSLIDEDGAVTWYADCDGDGYAASRAPTVNSCTTPAPGGTGCRTGLGTWTTRAPTDLTNTDCNDGNATVNPAQTMFQSSPIPGAPMSVDFDYDCDTVEEPRLPTDVARCRRVCVVGGPGGGGCRCVLAVPGWAGNSAPECGMSGRIARENSHCVEIRTPDGGVTCVATGGIPATQTCR